MNHNRSTALERSVKITWGLKPLKLLFVQDIKMPKRKKTNLTTGKKFMRLRKPMLSWNPRRTGTRSLTSGFEFLFRLTKVKKSYWPFLGSLFFWYNLPYCFCWANSYLFFIDEKYILFYYVYIKKNKRLKPVCGTRQLSCLKQMMKCRKEKMNMNVLKGG